MTWPCSQGPSIPCVPPTIFLSLHGRYVAGVISFLNTSVECLRDLPPVCRDARMVTVQHSTIAHTHTEAHTAVLASNTPVVTWFVLMAWRGAAWRTARCCLLPHGSANHTAQLEALFMALLMILLMGLLIAPLMALLKLIMTADDTINGPADSSADHPAEDLPQDIADGSLALLELLMTLLMVFLRTLLPTALPVNLLMRPVKVLRPTDSPGDGPMIALLML